MEVLAHGDSEERRDLPFRPRVLRLGSTGPPEVSEPCKAQVPVVLRLRQNTSTYQTSAPNFFDEGTGGPDLPDDPVLEADKKRSKKHGEALTSLSTSSSPIESSSTVPGSIVSLRARSPMGVIRRNLEVRRLQGGTATATATVPVSSNKTATATVGGGGSSSSSTSSKGNLSMFSLSCDTPYYLQQDEWSCGYRNFQMLFGGLVMINEDSKWKPTDEESANSLTQSAETSLPSDFSQSAERSLPSDFGTLVMHAQRGFSSGTELEENPTVEDLQRQLERAWLQGFDPEGCEMFKPEGVLGTKKWIGATEIWALLSSLGLVCKIVDFEVQEGTFAGDRVLQWLSQYFLDEAVSDLEICESYGWGLAWMAAAGTKPPVHLQHHSHSRTVVGATKIDNELFLIVLDPAKHHEIDVNPKGNCLELLVSASDLSVNDQYQLVHVLRNLPAGSLSESEEASMKDPNRNLFKH